MEILGALILAWLVARKTKQAFQDYARNLLDSIPDFDPNEEVDALTPTQIEWLEEVFQESQTQP